MDFIGQMVAQNLGDYEERCVQALRYLARTCALDTEIEVERYRRLMNTMGKVPQANGPLDPNNPFAALQNQVIAAMPPVVEFVTTHTAGELKGFGYLTEGRPGQDLPSTLMAKLENSFRICLTEAGGMADGHIFKAYQPGGPSSGILPASINNVPLDFDTLQKHDSFIGSAAVVVLSTKDSIRDAAINMLRFFEDESCGQCTPCRLGCEKALKLMSEAKLSSLRIVIAMRGI